MAFAYPDSCFGASPGSARVSKISCASCPAQWRSSAFLWESFLTPLASRKNWFEPRSISRSSYVIVWVRVVLRGTFVAFTDKHFSFDSGCRNVFTNNSSFENSPQPDYLIIRTNDCWSLLCAATVIFWLYLIQRSWLKHSCSVLFRHLSSNYTSHLNLFSKHRYLWTTA